MPLQGRRKHLPSELDYSIFPSWWIHVDLLRKNHQVVLILMLFFSEENNRAWPLSGLSIARRSYHSNGQLQRWWTGQWKNNRYYPSLVLRGAHRPLTRKTIARHLWRYVKIVLRNGDAFTTGTWQSIAHGLKLTRGHELEFFWPLKFEACGFRRICLLRNSFIFICASVVSTCAWGCSSCWHCKQMVGVCE